MKNPFSFTQPKSFLKLLFPAIIALAHTSCDSDSGGDSDNDDFADAESGLRLPVVLQAGDEITIDPEGQEAILDDEGNPVLDGDDNPTFNNDTFSIMIDSSSQFTLGETAFRIDEYIPAASQNAFFINNAFATVDQRVDLFNARIVELLTDFSSQLRTLVFARNNADEEITQADLQVLVDEINETSPDALPLVMLDPGRGAIMLILGFDFRFQITSGSESFETGIFTGTYEETRKVYPIFLANAVEREVLSLRLLPEHRVPRVDLDDIIAVDGIDGSFIYNLSAVAPPADD
ncbi:MAG: hypothetical protein AB8F34_06150 [Akkermansiaceae bacterium]